MFYISQIQDIYMYGSRKQLETCIMFFLFWDNLDLSGGIQFLSSLIFYAQKKNTCHGYKHTYMHTDICIYFGGNAYTEIDGGKLTFFPFFCSFCTDCSANPYAYIHISPLIVYAIIKHSYDYFIATYFREYRYRYTGERCINCMY